MPEGFYTDPTQEASPWSLLPFIGLALIGFAILYMCVYVAIIDCIKKCLHQQPDTSQPERSTLFSRDLVQEHSLRTQFGSPGRDSVELVEPDKEVARRS